MILIVDDAPDSQLLTRRILQAAGYTEIQCVGSAREAFDFLGIDGAGSPPTHIATRNRSPIELVLMDLVMPDLDGIEACRRISTQPDYADTPILMLTARPEREDLGLAFAAGAWDYLRKPIERPVFLARVRNALRLKQEIERRKTRERELVETKALLEQANCSLHALALSDGLTGIANRRHFQGFLEREWLRAARTREPLALIMVDIDCFKRFNDARGHQAGDDCLRRIAAALQEAVFRPGDLVARYGGEELSVILTDTDAVGAREVAERLRTVVRELRIPHPDSPTGPWVTISLGVASVRPESDISPETLVAQADGALYQAKHSGRDQVCLATEIHTLGGQPGPPHPGPEDHAALP